MRFNVNVMKKRAYMPLFACLAMLSWSLAFPFIKLGMKWFEINGADTGSKLLFAGVRFFLAGVFVLAYLLVRGSSIKIPSAKSAFHVFLLAIVNTSIHYMAFYLGLSNCAAGKSSIIDSLGTFWLIILACIIYKEQMTPNKFLGCILGFSGIVLVNFNHNLDISFHLNGEGFLLLSTVCAAFGGLLIRVVTKSLDAVTATGYSLAIGGVFLIFAGLILGGHLKVWNITGIGILIALILISISGFIIYNQLITYHPVSEVAIFNALIPAFGTIVSFLFLGEQFRFRYFIAILLIGTGIYAVNRKGKCVKNE